MFPRIMYVVLIFSTLIPNMVTPSTQLVQYPGTLDKATIDLVKDGALLSWLAYSDPDTVDRQWRLKLEDPSELSGAFEVLNRVTERPRYITVSSCDAQCYVVKYNPPPVDDIQSKPLLTVAARGTTSCQDWACDFDAVQTAFRDCNDQTLKDVKVHAGFYLQFIALFSQIDEEIKSHLGSGGNVFVTGHSLGGAVSTLFAANFASGYPHQIWHSSYGSPRTGNQMFADIYNSVVSCRARVKNASDPVPSSVPPINYSHVGYEVHLGFPDLHNDIPILLSVCDHDIARYATILNSPDQSLTMVTPKHRYWMLDVLDRFRKPF